MTASSMATVHASTGAVPPFRRVLLTLASSWVAALCFVLLAAGALGVSEADGDATWLMLGPLLLLALSLGAAIATKARLRSDVFLLVFHLALLVLVLLFGLARMTYFEATTSLTAGRHFANELENVVRGPWHGGDVSRLDFRNEGFAEQFARTDAYGSTVNRVSWRDSAGKYRMADIGDHVPLILDGYRIYTARRGYAPLLLWQAKDGESQYGALQLQRNPETAGQYDLAGDWRLPGGDTMWVSLELAESLRRDAGTRPGLDAERIPHQLVLRIGEVRHALQTGEVIDLPGGTLTYVRLGTWMGYRIIYDPVRPWIVGCVIVAVISLLLFYARVIGRRRQGEDA